MTEHSTEIEIFDDAGAGMTPAQRISTLAAEIITGSFMVYVAIKAILDELKLSKNTKDDKVVSIKKLMEDPQ